MAQVAIRGLHKRFGHVHVVKGIDLEHKFSPEISAYWDRIIARPGFAAAKAAQERAS